jgi:hypothetical protein
MIRIYFRHKKEAVLPEGRTALYRHSAGCLFFLRSPPGDNNRGNNDYTDVYRSNHDGYVIDERVGLVNPAAIDFLGIDKNTACVFNSVQS